MSTPTQVRRKAYLSRPHIPLREETRSLFQWTNPSRFGHASDEELAEHITAVRNKAWDATPYPCLGLFHFLLPGIAQQRQFQYVIEALSAPAPGGGTAPMLLDLACAVGQDPRALLQHSGGKIPSERIVAADLMKSYMDIGFELFGDEPGKGRIAGVKWEVADVFRREDLEKLKALSPGGAGFQFIYIGSFIHLFDLESSKQVIDALDFLLSDEPGSLIFGRQTAVAEGTAGPTTFDFAIGPADKESYKQPYRHDTTTFAALFHDRCPGKFHAEAKYVQRESPFVGEPTAEEAEAYNFKKETMWMSFEVKRG